MRKYFLSLLLAAVINITFNVVSGQEDSSVVFLPGNRIYPVVFLDPLECQIMGGSYLLFQKDMDLSLYSTVNLGFSKPVISKVGKKISWELNFGTAIFSQFDLIRKDDGTFLAGLINNDFKLSGDLSVRAGNNLLRLRTFHISSHLGDDYLERHNDTLTNDKTVNYEQVDLTYMRMYRNNYFYAGAGYIYTINVFRERFSFQAGGLINFMDSRPVSYFAGLDMKLLEENSFIPDIRTAFGINFNRKAEPLLRIWAEYYSGRLPYSTIDYGRVNWVGAGIILNIIK
jgi:hypothetical protein